jgi:hypothetical protein
MDTAVARNARQIIHQSDLAADKPVEEGGLTDIRTADNGEGETQRLKFLC